MQLEQGENTIKDEEFTDLGIRLTLTDKRLILERRKGLLKTWKIDRQVKLEEIYVADCKPHDSSMGAIHLVLEMKNHNIIDMGTISNNNQSPLDEENTSNMKAEELSLHAGKLAAHSAKAMKDNLRASSWVAATNGEARKFPVK